MFNKVVKDIQDGLIDHLGAANGTDVDKVLNYLPSGSITGNKTVAVVRRSWQPLQWEIGVQAIPSKYTFSIDIFIITSSSTDEEAETDDLQKLEMKVLDYLGRVSNLRALQYTEEKQTFSVIDALVKGVAYPETINQFDKGTQVSIIQLDVRIQHITNA